MRYCCRSFAVSLGFYIHASIALAATCQGLSFTQVSLATDPTLKELNTSLTNFEQAFVEHDISKLKKTLHPALLMEPRKLSELFDNTFAAYGLEKPKLIRSAIYDLDFGANPDIPVACTSLGDIKGVIGIKRQFAVFHSVITGHEQIRFMSLFASPLQTQLDMHKNAPKMGLVMWQVQIFTAGGKSAESLLSQAKKWSALKEPFTAWVFTQGAMRLLEPNPYFIPRETYEAKLLLEQYSAARPSAAQVQEQLTQNKLDWEFIDYSVVFQAQGIAPALKFRMRKTEVVQDLISKCDKHVAAMLPLLGEVRRNFTGIECLPYAEKESIQYAPQAGTSFVKL